MAEHIDTIPLAAVPQTAVQEVRDAIYEASVVTDIIARLAKGDIGSTDRTCAPAYEWLAGIRDGLVQIHRRLREIVVVTSDRTGKPIRVATMRAWRFL